MSKKALLIGINYIGTKVRLTGCINDITNISKVLRKFNYNCLCLTDRTPLKPTKKNIIEQLKLLVSNAEAGDTLIFYYCGHGSRIKDTDNDEVDKLDEVFVPLDYLKEGIITDDELFSLIKIKNDVKFYGFTDCCHSGTICDLKYNLVPNCKLKKGIVPKSIEYNRNDWTDDFTKSLTLKEKPEGMIFFISGCKDNQVSVEMNNQGAFTYCFLKLFNKNNFVNNKYTFKDLLKYIYCNLQIIRMKQVPQLSSNLDLDLDLFFNI